MLIVLSYFVGSKSLCMEGTTMMSHIFFLSIIFNPLSLYSVDQITASRKIITNNNEWMIVSPKLASAHQVQRSMHHDPYLRLKNIGEQADKFWRISATKEELVRKLDALFDGADNQFLIALIDQLIADDQLLQQITQASYHNVTGFLKIVLLDGGKDSWKIRLHVWQEKEEKEFPHNHKWDFFSKIVAGYLTQDQFERCEATSDAGYVVCEPVSLMPILASGELPCPCRDNYELVEKCSLEQHVGLNLKRKDTIGAGESYFMPNYIVHAINPGRDAISLVFTSEKITENSEVFVPYSKIDNDLAKNAPSVTKEELVQELLRVKKILQRLQLQQPYLPEVVDAQHRYFGNKGDLFARINWRAAMHECLISKHVRQLSKDEAEKFKATVHDNKLMVGDSSLSSNAQYLFVLLNDVMYICEKDFNHRGDLILCHSSFTDYAPVDAAGVLHTNEHGDIIALEAYSGHYAPQTSNMEIVKEYLAACGLPIDDLMILGYKDRV